MDAYDEFIEAIYNKCGDDELLAIVKASKSLLHLIDSAVDDGDSMAGVSGVILSTRKDRLKKALVAGGFIYGDKE